MNHITMDTLWLFSAQNLIALSLFICRMNLSVSRLSTFLLALLTLFIFLVQCWSVLKIATYIKPILRLDNWSLGNWIIYVLRTESGWLDFFGGSLQPQELVLAVSKRIVIIPAYNQTADLNSVFPKSQLLTSLCTGFSKCSFKGPETYFTFLHLRRILRIQRANNTSCEKWNGTAEKAYPSTPRERNWVTAGQ